MYVFKFGDGEYLTEVNSWRCRGGGIKNAKLFSCHEELITYFVSKWTNESREFIEKWMTDNGNLVFQHPLNIPEK